MTVVYRDEIGTVAVTLTDGETGESIDFANGKCYFMVGDKDYAVPVENLVRIVR
jgi:hypothetical protein